MPTLNEPVTERRRITRNSIYRYLYQAQTPRTKQDIAQALAFSLPTVHQNLSELLAAGLVERGALQRSTGGRRATGMAIAANARFAVGVSVTQERFRFLAANLRMEEIAYRSEETGLPPHTADAAALGVRLAAALEHFLTDFGLNRNKLLGVGIALPAILDAQGQTILFSPTMALNHCRTADLTQALPYPAHLANDATAGGYAEWLTQGSGSSLAYLSLENGVGGAVLLGGAPYHGLNGRSGEFGHICIVPGGLPCPCGKRGCLEAYCSAARISSDLGLTVEDFFEALARTPAQYQPLWEDYLQHLAIGIHNIRMILDCDIVLGGFLTQYLAPYMPHLQALVAAQSPFQENAGYLRLGQYPKRAIPLGVALHFINDFIQKL
ncbi:MAG: ROK family transcriptional regulator [Pygmaiobacter sp.]|nr:ROK family transcriptional regulator [Pygmaiobacter sp.]